MSISISVSPAVYTPRSGTQLFTATVLGDPTNAGVTWSLSSEAILPLFDPYNATLPTGNEGIGNGLTALFAPLSVVNEQIGTIDQTGLYTAPSLMRTTPARCAVVATSNADGRTQGTAVLLLLNSTFTAYTHARKKDDQWDVCTRCGISYPMARLTQQKGNLYCTKTCWDNLQVERRPREIQQILSGSSSTPEASDRRVIDRGFFVIDVETG